MSWSTVGARHSPRISLSRVCAGISVSFLIVDANSDNALSVWVGTDEPVAAMRALDMVGNRGYVLISNPGRHRLVCTSRELFRRFPGRSPV